MMEESALRSQAMEGQSSSGTGVVRRSPNVSGEVSSAAAYRPERGDPAHILGKSTFDKGPISRITIECILPCIPDGLSSVKTIIGRDIVVTADVFIEGHRQVAADLLWQAEDEAFWHRVLMVPCDNDQWEARFCPPGIGRYHFAIEAWSDNWDTFAYDLKVKRDAGGDTTVEAIEGRHLIRTADKRANGRLSLLPFGDINALASPVFSEAMRWLDARAFTARSAVTFVWVDRRKAEFSSWYEVFPRSGTQDSRRLGTLSSVIERLPDICRMGFDVLYFPPIHPIGRINRKGRNDSLISTPGDIGSPYAIGSSEGGHDTVHPDLGTLADFRKLVAAAYEHGIEIALDFAAQCAPDHPWLRRHDSWFQKRPDGSIRYAENPPKKYQDIVNPEFYEEESFPAIWIAIRDILMLWIDLGIRIFRIDNPHTKPIPFWEWLINTIQHHHPDVLFLAEAFTKPNLMYKLAKIGFSQSYTYFTWRNEKEEILEYLTELSTVPIKEFFRPNFFVNTPDINPFYLQQNGRQGFLVRAVLASTLSGNWGMYSGFEICESDALPGREEYLNSEKYEIRIRDFDAAESIVYEIGKLNRIRHTYPMLQSHQDVQFLNAFSSNVIVYSRGNSDDERIMLIAVNLNPEVPSDVAIEIPFWRFGLDENAIIHVEDVWTSSAIKWRGKFQIVRFERGLLPFRMWSLLR